MDEGTDKGLIAPSADAAAVEKRIEDKRMMIERER